MDTATLTVTINQAIAQADPTSADLINFAVVFNKSVSNFDTTDAAQGGTEGGSTATVTGSGTTYNVAINGATTTCGRPRRAVQLTWPHDV